MTQRYKNKFRQRWYSEGLCVACGREKENERSKRVTCRKCMQDMVEDNKRKRAKWLFEGKCARCGNSEKLINLKNISSSRQHKETIDRLCLRCYLKHISYTVLGTSKNWEQLLNLYNMQDGRCKYSGKKIIIGKGAVVDHREPALGKKETDIGNLQWVDFKINFMKRDLPEKEFLELCQLIARNYKKS